MDIQPPTTDRLILLRNRVSCSECGAVLDRTDRGTWQFLSGWARINRAQGGQNGLTLAEYHGRFACNACIDRMRKNINLNQGLLF